MISPRQITELRRREGVDQGRMAAHVGVSRSLWNRWENGRARPGAGFAARLEAEYQAAFPGDIAPHYFDAVDLLIETGLFTEAGASDIVFAHRTATYTNATDSPEGRLLPDVLTHCATKAEMSLARARKKAKAEANRRAELGLQARQILGKLNALDGVGAT